MLTRHGLFGGGEMGDFSGEVKGGGGCYKGATIGIESMVQVWGEWIAFKSAGRAG